MPRKRQTKTRTVARPDVASVNAETMSQQELKSKEHQLVVLLSDFDITVANILKKMEKDQKTMEIFIRKTFQDAIAKLPTAVRKMTMKEYAMSYGKEQAGPSVVAPVSKKAQLEEIQNFVWKAPAETMEKIEEEEKPEAVAPSTVSTAKAKSTVRTTKGRKGKSTMPPPSSRTTRARQPQNTPLTRLTAGNYGQTPLFTPKFDPNLPITPAVTRDAKAGEILVSAAGSPVMISRRRAFGVNVNVNPETMDKFSQIIENETEEKINRILQLITENLDQE